MLTFREALEGELDVPAKLEELGKHLKRWALLIKKKRELLTKLEELNEKDLEKANLVEIIEVKLALNLEADKEELFWEQRAQANWLKMGNQNTSYFHKFATQRKKRNTVQSLEDENGERVEGEEGLSKLATRYFKKLFSASSICDSERLMAKIELCIKDNHNEDLNADFLKRKL